MRKGLMMMRRHRSWRQAIEEHRRVLRLAMRKRMTPGFVPVLVLIGLGFLVLPAAAQNRTSSPPPPTGIIYFAKGDVDQNFRIMGMKGDGTGQTTVLPYVWSGLGELQVASPSWRYYGADPMHDRWWVVAQPTGVYDAWQVRPGATPYPRVHYDLFAVRTDPADRNRLISRQLTDLFGKVCLFPPTNASAYWAPTDAGVDHSVVIPVGYDIRDHFYIDEQGKSCVAVDESAGDVRRAFRLPISADDVEAGRMTDSWIPFGPERFESEAELDFALEEISSPLAGAYGFPSGSESPEGSMNVRHTATDGYFITTPLDPTVILHRLANPGGGLGNSQFCKWSPDGSSVALVDGRSLTTPTNVVRGSLYVQSLETDLVRPLVLSTSSVRRGTTTSYHYFFPIWSPDSKYLVARRYTMINGVAKNETLVRVSVDNGAVVDLKTTTSYLSLPLRWVSGESRY
ncbi:MAG TPA: hypothetical protein DCQ98_15030 [Planctomycetaceae bacterium]|nr:hypothetical protein [Planctomycetaceae bacterium]HRF01811.1 hypothetical protein [Pirellulaceae bacterium]